jgi:hypothetical protein
MAEHLSVVETSSGQGKNPQNTAGQTMPKGGEWPEAPALSSARGKEVPKTNDSTCNTKKVISFFRSICVN